jgi:hypothetical protein
MIIANGTERQATLAAVLRFEQALAHMDVSGAEADPFLREVMRDQIAGELDALRAQLAEYEARTRPYARPADALRD